MSITATIDDKQVDFTLNLDRVEAGAKKGSDLGDIEGAGPIDKMFLNPSVLGKVTWDVFADRIEAAQVAATYDDLKKKLDGSALRSVECAMKEAIADFFSWGTAGVTRLEKAIDKMLSAPEASGQPSSDAPES
ncbi:MAG: hypothetical protein AAFX06_14970 [Planctomycetota bacterium]